MRLAVCDDEEREVNTILELLHGYRCIQQTDITCFSSALSLYESSQQEPFDIVLLDIEMSHPTGYEIAQKLITEPQTPLIIFVTNSMEYTLLGYGVAFRYLTKPLSAETLYPVLDCAIAKLANNRFSFSINDTTYILKTNDIYYIDVYNHTTIVHTVDKNYTLRSSLKDILKQLPSSSFSCPNQSYLVNLAHVDTYSTSEVKLSNGTSIPISRRRLTDFEYALNHYLGGV
jgi:DNA-binding LytR/AlgR family response regulator